MNALGTSYAQARTALATSRDATTAADDAIEAMARDLNHLAVAARFAIDVMDDLSTDAFAEGGDRPARAELIRALARIGRVSDDERFEYRSELGES